MSDFIIVYNIENLELAIEKGKQAYRAKFNSKPCMCCLSSADMQNLNLTTDDEFCGLKIDRFRA